MQKKIINEARLFSKLHHPNVVRYYNAWVSKCVICKDGNNKSTPADNIDKDKNIDDVNSKSKSKENLDSYAGWEPSYAYKDNDYSSSDDSDNEDNDEESVGDSSRITPVSANL
uniref:Protein kinase domain-containing protein n=1 Tax=Strongyloides papillosus TaxID=174720 RepID=A0A0N5BBU0_STREA